MGGAERRLSDAVAARGESGFPTFGAARRSRFFSRRPGGAMSTIRNARPRNLHPRHRRLLRRRRAQPAIPPLGRWNIPEAVTGRPASPRSRPSSLYDVFGLKIVFDLEARDTLLLYFFTGIGLNARFGDLVAGGRPLMKLLALTLAYLVVQNLIAAGGAAALGLPNGVTALLGSAALIGGHGTTIAWAPMIEERFGLEHALEIGVASATLGLVARASSAARPPGSSIARYGLSGPRDARRSSA